MTSGIDTNFSDSLHHLLMKVSPQYKLLKENELQTKLQLLAAQEHRSDMDSEEEDEDSDDEDEQA